MPAVFFEKKDEEKIMIPERLAALREKMRAYGVDAYLVPTADYHESEYVGTYFKSKNVYHRLYRFCRNRRYYQDEACLWTDGRYFVQAAKRACRNRRYFNENGPGRCSDRRGIPAGKYKKKA